MYLLGAWLVEPTARRISRGSETSRLSPKAMMPNKFFEGEEVVDFLGKDWEKSWGHAMQ